MLLLYEISEISCVFRPLLSRNKANRVAATMPGRLNSLTKPIAARFSSPMFRKRSKHLFELEDQKRLGNFVENLTRELQNLKPVDGEAILRLEWLHRVVSLALKEHKDAVDLIPKVDCPLSKPGEAWMSEYFDATTTILEVCNSLRASISNVEHGHLLAKYAICVLEKHDTFVEETNLICARRSLQDWTEVVQHAEVSTPFSSAEPEDRHVRLQRMLNGLKTSGERAPAHQKGFLEALYGAKTTAILACTALTIGLSGKSDFSIARFTPNSFEWASSVTYLLQRCSSEARENMARGLSGRVEEMEDVNCAVQKLVGTLEERRFPISKEERDEISGKVEELKSSWEILALELEKVRETVDEFVHSIISSRSSLLAHVRLSVPSAYL